MKSEVEVLREALEKAKQFVRGGCSGGFVDHMDHEIAAILAQSTTPSREERLEVALEVAKVIIMESNPVTFEKFYAEIDSVLNPPPEYEEVEVVRWVCLVSEEGCGSTYREQDLSTTPADAVPCTYCGKTAFRMVGTITREKPRKVQRRVSVNARVNAEGYVTSKTDNTGYTKIAFWHEDACKGKTGTLTFTWEEQP